MKKLALHTGFRSAQKAVSLRPPPPAPKPEAPISRRAMRDRMPTMAPKKSGGQFSRKPGPLMTKG